MGLTGGQHGAPPRWPPVLMSFSLMSRKWIFAVAVSVLAVWMGLSCAQAAESVRASASPTLDTDPHLVAWWKFDEAAGKSAADSSSKGHPGALQGALSFETHSAAGRTGNALKFEGKDCVKIPDYKGVTGTRARTVAAWIKTKSGSGDIAIWGHDDHGNMFIFGHIRGRIGVTPKGGYLYMRAGTADDAWHHVAVVVREASLPNLHDDVKIYRDGEAAEIDDIGLLDLWPIETGEQQDVTIGRGFKGLLDDVRIYDRPLSEDEIKTLYKLQTNRPLAKS